MKTTFFLFLLTQIFLQNLALASNGITYHGRIIKPSGQPLESAAARFRIQIKAPDTGNCVLWEEEQTRNMLGSGGVFTITIGDSTNTGINYSRIDSYAWSMERVFSNRLPFNSLSGCSVGGPNYIPNPTDGRILEVSFKELATDPDWEDFPATKINMVPLALNSLQLEGYRANEFLKIDPITNQTPLSNASVNSLLTIIAGTSTLYAKPTDALGGDLSGTLGSGTVVGIRGRAITPDVPAAGQVLKFDGTAWAPANDDSGGSMGDASYAAKGIVRFDTDAATSGITVAAGVARLADTITAAGPVGGASTVPVITYDAKGRLTTVSTATVNDATKLSLAGGTMTGPVNMGLFNITNATSVAANNFSGRNLLLTDVDTNTITLRTPNDISANYTLTLPLSAPTNGYVLSSDGTGQLSWIPAAGGSVTAVTATAPVLSSGGATPVISLDTGLGASKIPQVGGSALAANGVIVANGLGTALTSLNCTVGQVVKFDASGFAMCAADNTGAANAFVNGGNSFTANATLGTNDAYALNFETQGTTKMTVLANGNVGIGTTSPTRLLEVAAASTSTSVAGNSNATIGILNTDLTPNNTMDLSFRTMDSSSSVIPVAKIVGVALGHGAGSVLGDLAFVTAVGGNFLTEKMRVTSGGNVGIGTTSPSAVLNLKAGTTASGTAPLKLTAGANLTTAEPGAIEYDGTNLYFTDGTSSRKTLATSTGATGAFINGGNSFGAVSSLGSNDNYGFSLKTNGTTRLNFSNTGAMTATGSFSLTNDESSNSQYSAMNSALDISTMTAAAQTYKAATGTANINSGSGANAAAVHGGYFATYRGLGPNGGATAIYGVTGRVSDNGASGANSVASLIGVNSQADLGAQIDSTNLVGLQARTSYSGSGNLTNMIGLNLSGSKTSAGTLTNYFGVNIGSITNLSGTFTNSYGIYLGTLAATNRYAVYSVDPLAQSYFAGNVGIGTTSPARLLHVAGPMRMTPAALPGTPAAGDMAIDSGDANKLKFYNGSAWVEAGGSGGSGTVTSVSSANSDIAVSMASPTPVLTLNSGVGNNQIVKLNGSAELPAVSGVNLTSLNATNLGSGTVPAARMPALTGDVTTSAGAVATTIAANAVTSSKILDDEIIDADIKSNAAIARTKLASGTMNHVLINDGSGVMSSEANLAVSRGGTGVGSFVANKIVGTNGTGSALTSFTCTLDQVIKFDVSGNAVCGTDNTGAGSGFVDGGNTFSATATIGTNSNHNLEIETNGSTKMTVLANGNVGVGTTTPAAKLDLTSSTASTAFGTVSGFKNTMTFNNSATSLATVNAVETNAIFNGTASVPFGLTGEKVTAESTSTTDATTLTGISSMARYSSTGTLTTAYGVDSRVENTSTGNLANAVALRGSVTNGASSLMTTGKAGHFEVTNSGGSLSQAFGIFIGNIQGSTRYSLYASDPAAQSYFAGNVGIGTTTPTSPLHVAQNSSGAGNGTSRTSFNLATSHNIVGGSQTGYLYGQNIDISILSSSNAVTSSATATSSNLTVLGTSGTVTAASGTSTGLTNMTNTTVTSGYGVNAIVANLGTMTNAYGLNASVVRPSGTITNAYGVYVGDVQGTNKWSIYANDTAAPSYFAGNVGIGTTTPARLLHVAGPMRMTPAALPGTPAAGDMAIDSGDANKLKFYNGSAWVEAGGSGGGSGTVTSVSSANSDIAVSMASPTPVLTLNSGTAGGVGDADKIAKLSPSGLLAPNMIPNLDAGKITTGTLPVLNGGTGLTSFGTSSVIVSNVTGTGLASLNCTNGQVIKFDINGYAVCGADNSSGATGDISNGGNTTGAAVVIGSNDAQGLTLETDNSPRLTISAAGNVGIGTTNPSSRLKLQVSGGAVATTSNIIPTGASVDLSLSNIHLLKSVGGSAITLSNMEDGGTYTLFISDTTARTYTFTGCTSQFFSPANAETTFQSTYTITSIVDGANTLCYINWTTGYN